MTKIAIASVKVPRNRMRAIGDVKDLKSSMAEIGLQYPITVHQRGDDLVLVAGARRLKAAKALGWTEIEADVREEGTEADEALLWEIAENLHRQDLTTAERDEHIRAYAEILKNRQAKVAPQGEAKPGRKKTSVVPELVEKTGLSKGTVERALNPERKAKEAEKRKAKEAEAKEAVKIVRTSSKDRNVIGTAPVTEAETEAPTETPTESNVVTLDVAKKPAKPKGKTPAAPADPVDALAHAFLAFAKSRGREDVPESVAYIVAHFVMERDRKAAKQ